MKINNLLYSHGFPPAWKYPKEEQFLFRSAWCHGDAGVGFSIYMATKNMRGKKKYLIQKKALAIFIRGTKQHHWSRGIVEHSICHGAAGMAQMCLRVYKYSNDKLSETHRKYIWFFF
jgi:hypothetical protein